ncbi:transporter substrate-binding domain-containing protein [Litorilituus lipolyticus]|uniref:Transporter substrate-binding domain-containing protein n=2 Tax=Litorilituus lipolyticus TaxID=2491017 RepID=A0A502KSK0_9GAMM|nr:transporter substrate-binding domain-containing protein [Litorilituus lipolyticus]
MLRFLQGILFCMLFSASFQLFAKQELKIGVGNFPPFFVEEDQSGLFLEITEAIFEKLPEYQVKFIFMSNSRLAHEINSGKLLDVACNIFAGSEVKGHLSKPIFRYTDVAVTQKSKNLVIEQVSDLKNLSIAAYQGAKELLGKELDIIAKNNPNYAEYSHPKETTYLLATGKKQVRIGDINIFLYDLTHKQYSNGMNIKRNDFTIHRLWPDVYSHMAFKDEALRNTVDKIITELSTAGVFEQIYDKYHIN